MEYEVYTDGACSHNPGPGGYCYIVLPTKATSNILIATGGERYTSNNKMELTAIVKALQEIERRVGFFANVKVTIYSDSAYCINPIQQGWIKAWEADGWLTKAGSEVKNKELWEEIFRFMNHEVIHFKLIKVKGHSGNKYNEMADQKARMAVNRFK